MSGNNSMRFRPSALFPFVSSAIAFALVIVLVLSGTNPNSVPDAYLLSFNTTSVGTKLLEINAIDPATTATPAANAARDARSALLRRSIIADPVALGSTNSSTSSSSIDVAPTSVSVSAASTASSTPSAAPVLAVPQTSGTPNPAAIPIGVVGVAFQFMLNTFAAGTGAALQNVITTLVTTNKQSNGVAPIYTMHLSGMCKANTTETNSTSSFNTTSCFSYKFMGAYIANSTSNVSDSTLIAATNITVPFISKVPGFGKSTQSFIDTTAGVVLAVFIISLIGNGLSFILSIAAFIMPSNGKIHAAGAGITMLSSQMLQIAAITSTSIANGVSSGINSSSSVSGLSASVGGKFLAMIWVGYIAAQAANIYWTTTWFVKFRKTSFQRRQRTAQEMQAGYKAIGKEIRSDFRVRKAEYEDTEVLVNGPVEVRHWDDDYQKM